jgi:hypothetical protein
VAPTNGPTATRRRLSAGRPRRQTDGEAAAGEEPQQAQQARRSTSPTSTARALPTAPTADTCNWSRRFAARQPKARWGAAVLTARKFV